VRVWEGSVKKLLTRVLEEAVSAEKMDHLRVLSVMYILGGQRDIFRIGGRVRRIGSGVEGTVETVRPSSCSIDVVFDSDTSAKTVDISEVEPIDEIQFSPSMFPFDSTFVLALHKIIHLTKDELSKPEKEKNTEEAILILPTSDKPVADKPESDKPESELLGAEKPEVQ